MPSVRPGNAGSRDSRDVCVQVTVAYAQVGKPREECQRPYVSRYHSVRMNAMRSSILILVVLVLFAGSVIGSAAVAIAEPLEKPPQTKVSDDSEASGGSDDGNGVGGFIVLLVVLVALGQALGRLMRPKSRAARPSTVGYVVTRAPYPKM